MWMSGRWYQIKHHQKYKKGIRDVVLKQIKIQKVLEEASPALGVGPLHAFHLMHEAERLQ
jgi:hypothetical protein